MATKEKQSDSQSMNLSISSLKDMLVLAEDLKKFVKEYKASTSVQGKEFVNAEAWQYVGSRLGLIPMGEMLEDISTEDEIKYKASVKIIELATGRTIGRGFAVCSNKESGKKYYQEFAIASMAQTRCIGKAFRIPLSFVIKLAGYEPTPAEEMDFDTKTEEAPKKATPVKKEAPKKAEAPAADKPEDAPQIKYASAAQKENIIRLLNNPVITRQEKTKMLLSINRFDEERASQAIEKLEKVIEDREDGQAAAAGNA